MKGHDSAGRDHHRFTRAGIPSLARALTADCKLAKALNGDRFTCLKGGLEEIKNPVQDRGRFMLRDPGLLMNASRNSRFCIAVTFPPAVGSTFPTPSRDHAI